MSQQKRASYTLDYKIEAVRLVRSGQRIAAVSKTLGIADQTLNNWIRVDDKGKLTGSVSKPVSGIGASQDGARYPKKSDGVLRQGIDVKCAWVLRNKEYWPVSLQCEVLGVSPSGYHEHFARRATPQQRKHLSDDALLVHIKAIHVQSKAEYGWPRVWKELLIQGIPVGKEQVRKLMQLHGIKARSKRKFQPPGRWLVDETAHEDRSGCWRVTHGLVPASS